MNRKFYIFLLIFLSYPSFAFFGSEENIKEICLQDVDGEERNPPLITNLDCFDRNSCPIVSEMKKNHYLVLVDTTEGLSDNEIGFLRNDVLSVRTLNLIEPYSKLSVFNVNDKVVPSDLKPLAWYCRPRSGNKASPYEADYPHKSQGVKVTRKNFQNWGIATRKKSIESLSKETKAQRTLLFEHINSITTLPIYEFRGEDYKNRTLILFSDLLQFSKRINLKGECGSYDNRKKCLSFDRFYNTTSTKVKRYLDEIKPAFSSNSKVIIYHVINKEIKGKPLERNLKGFWISFFEWAGVKKENIDYRMLFDSV